MESGVIRSWWSGEHEKRDLGYSSEHWMLPILQLLTPLFSHILRETSLKSTRCCIPLEKPSMNKLYRLPLRTRTKNLSSGVRRRQNSSKILATVILALCALAALVAIGFAAVFTFKHMTAKPKAVAASTPSPGGDAFACDNGAQAKGYPACRCRTQTRPASEATPSAHPAASPQPSALCLDFDGGSDAGRICCATGTENRLPSEGDRKTSNEGLRGKISRKSGWRRSTRGLDWSRCIKITRSQRTPTKREGRVQRRNPEIPGWHKIRDVTWAKSEG